jgi:hypothetical protein
VLLLLLPAACDRDPEEVQRGRDIEPGEDRTESRVAFFSRETSVGLASVRLSLDPSVVAPGEPPTVTISNEGDVEIGYGNPFELFILKGDDWQLVPNQIAFTLELQQMLPGEMKQQEIAVYDESGNEVRLRPGVYRYAKDLFIEALRPDDEKVTLRATFRVESGRE